MMEAVVTGSFLMGGSTEESHPLKNPVSYSNKSFHIISNLTPPLPLPPPPPCLYRDSVLILLEAFGSSAPSEADKKNHKKANKTSTRHRKLIPSRSENCFAPKVYHANGNMLIKPFASPILFSFLHLFLCFSPFKWNEGVK